MVQHRLEDTLSEELLAGRIRIGDQVCARAENGMLIYQRIDKEPIMIEA